MGRNVQSVLQHLGSAAEDAPRLGRPDLWHALLGDLTQPLLGLCDSIDEVGIGQCLAVVFFADQSKAFERIGIIWLLHVLHVLS